MSLRSDFYLFILILVLFSCSENGGTEEVNDAGKLFRQVSSEESGIAFSNDLQDTEGWNIIEYLYFYNGAGVAAGDVNNDGLVDLFFTSNQGDNTLYLNRGDLKFEDNTIAAGIKRGGWSTGVTMADVNGDGWLDIYVCQVGGYKSQQGKNQLYINQRDGTFTEQADAYGLAFSGLSTHAAFFDYDNDGDLDMYLLNHSVHSVNTYGPSSIRNETDKAAGDRLFANQLDKGDERFIDVTAVSGIYSSQIGYGLGIRIVDYNNDGWSDIYVSNDFHENDYLYENQHDGTFVERGEVAFGHTSRYSMGNDAGDINNDGLSEIITLDMLPADPKIIRKSVAEDRNEVRDIKADFGYGPQSVRNGLQFNWGNGKFSDIGPYAGVYATDWSWAPLIGDFDNDGWNDIYITNGIARRPNDLDYIQYFANTSGRGKDPDDQELIQVMPEVRIANYMFRNKRDYTFEDVTDAWGLNIPSFSHGSVMSDLDNDGDLDIAVNNVNGKAFLFENRSNESSPAHYLKIRLADTTHNIYGIGARVHVYTGSNMYSAEIVNARGFMSSAAPEALVGLGQSTFADSVVVIWTGNYRQSTERVQADTLLVIQRQADDYLPSRESEPSFQLLSAGDLSSYLPTENSDFRDYQREALIPYNLSNEGPAVAMTDLNGDGLPDVFIGGSHGTEPSLWLQGKNYTFIRKMIEGWKNEAPFEDVDAIFFDSDGDGDQDLYVVRGGNQFSEGNFLLQDALFINDGNGNFVKAGNIEGTAFNGSVVRAADFDGDGDLDLFIGARSVPGAYGQEPESIILTNQNGKFNRDDNFSYKGMVTAAEWGDIDGDQDLDLVIAGDWQPITIMENTPDGFTKKEVPGSSGWWRSLRLIDADYDSRLDIVAGNIGLNQPLKATNGKPVTLLLSDFDGNGQTDPIIFHFKGDEEIPFASKDEIDKQIPAMKKKFTSYKAYSEATDLKTILRTMGEGPVVEKRVETFAHSVFYNRGEMTFKAVPLPGKVQWTCINDILDTDDGMLLSGNSNSGNTALGPLDAMPLMSLEMHKDGFKEGVYFNSGDMSGVIRKVLPLSSDGDKAFLIVWKGRSPRILVMR